MIKRTEPLKEFPLEWNVIVSDFNGGEIVTHNVFYHYSLIQDLGKTLRKLSRKKDMTEAEKRQEFADNLKTDMMYYYWSKSEWEVIVSHWPPGPPERFRDAKIDVYDQVMLNWDKFVDYAWNNRKLIMKLAKENK